MENPNNWSMVELEGPSDDDFLLPNGDVSISDRPKSKARRNKNAKQLTWVLLLKAHKAAGCLSSITSAFFSLSSAVCRRLAAGRTDIRDTENSKIQFKKIKLVLKQGAEDLEYGDGGGYFPMVLVQIPMCNEKEVIFGGMKDEAVMRMMLLKSLRIKLLKQKMNCI